MWVLYPYITSINKKLNSKRSFCKKREKLVEEIPKSKNGDEPFRPSPKIYYSFTTLAACGPRLPSTISKETDCPSSKVLNPSP